MPVRWLYVAGVALCFSDSGDASKFSKDAVADVVPDVTEWNQCSEVDGFTLLQRSGDPPRPFTSFAGGGTPSVDTIGSMESGGTPMELPRFPLLPGGSGYGVSDSRSSRYPTAVAQTLPMPQQFPNPSFSWENKGGLREVETGSPFVVSREPQPNAEQGSTFAGGENRDHLPFQPSPVDFRGWADSRSRAEFANGASRFAGGGSVPLGFHGSRSGSSGSSGSLPGGFQDPISGARSFGSSPLVREPSGRWPPFSGSGQAPLYGPEQNIFASGKPSQVKSGPNVPTMQSEGETYSVDCGTSVIQTKTWHYTFRPPNTGDFNIPITVHKDADHKFYQIARMEVSVSANLDNWQPFQLRLIGPSRTSILLKESGTSECEDLRCDFSETTSCHSCTRPKETLSAFTGESALGTWILSFEDAEGRKRTGAMAWAALKITWSCEPPLDQ